MFLGQPPQGALLRRAESRPNSFESLQSSLFEFLDMLLGLRELRVGPGGQASVRSGDLNGLDVGEVNERDLSKVRAEITIEGFLKGRHMACADKVLGKVESCERTLTLLCRIMGRLEVGQGGGDSHRIITLCSVPTSFFAKGPKRLGHGSRKVDQQMIFDALMGPAHLCSSEQRQRVSFDFVDAGLEAGGHIVIGEGDEIEAPESTTTEHIIRGIPSIGQGRVDVQIDACRGCDGWGEQVHHRWWISNCARGLAETSWVPIRSRDTPCFAAAVTQS